MSKSIRTQSSDLKVLRKSFRSSQSNTRKTDLLWAILESQRETAEAK